jgi:hypothetical protein
MRDTLLLGFRRMMIPIPPGIWRRRVAAAAQKEGDNVRRVMTEEHHRVRDCVVRELPRMGEPLSPEWIAQTIDMPLDRLRVILDDLEKRLIFLFRNAEGSVVWAYPVTVDRTPHRVTYSTGETGYAA